MLKEILMSPFVIFMMALFTGKLFDVVIIKHDYTWYILSLFVIGLIYSIWYLTSLFKQIIKK